MRPFNPHYFNACRLLYKLSLLVMCAFLLACSRQNSAKQVLTPERSSQKSESLININTVSVTELEKLPHIGAQKAREIIEYRETFGNFRRSEHLMLVRGISDRRFREITHLIRVE